MSLCLVHCQTAETSAPSAPAASERSSALGVVSPPPIFIPWGETLAIAGLRFDDPGAGFPYRYHTFVAQFSGAVKQIQWSPLRSSTVSDVAGFSTSGLVSMAAYAGETGDTRHVLVAESDGDVYELTATKDGAATATYVGWFGWMVSGGTVRAATGFVQNGVRYVALLWDSGDIFWISRSDWGTGRMIGGLYSATSLASYTTRDGKPRLVVGPYWSSAYWTLGGSDLRDQTTLRLKFIEYFDNVVAVSAHSSPETGAHVVFAASDGTISEAHLDDSDALAAASGNPERGWTTVTGDIRGITSYMVAGYRQHLLVATRDGNLRLLATAGNQPLDQLLIDSFDRSSGADTGRCLPGGADYFYVNIERTTTSFPSNTVVVPDQGTISYSVSRGGPATSAAVTLDGTSQTVAFDGVSAETRVLGQVQVSAYGANLNHQIQVTGACGTVARGFTSLSYASAPTFKTIYLNLSDKNNPTYTKLAKGYTATITYDPGPAPVRCGTRTITTVGRNDQGVQNFIDTQTLPVPFYGLGSVYHSFPRENTTYTVTMSCSESHLQDTRTLRADVYDAPPSAAIAVQPLADPKDPYFAYIPVGGQITLTWVTQYPYGSCGSTLHPQVIIEGRNQLLGGQSDLRFREEYEATIDPNLGVNGSGGTEKITVSLDTDTYFTVKTLCNGIEAKSATVHVRLYQTASYEPCTLKCYKIDSSVSGICSLLQWCVPQSVSDPLQAVQSVHPTASVEEVSDCYNYSICY
ncbi:MAG TPA: hypothetical protein VHU81_01700 [Thermoanaerobaculia bacterium]|nr:hypothetical protein [Thermoanaerobaculia bacterium]